MTRANLRILYLILTLALNLIRPCRHTQVKYIITFPPLFIHPPLHPLIHLLITNHLPTFLITIELN